jgi:hypothetical protein
MSSPDKLGRTETNRVSNGESFYCATTNLSTGDVNVYIIGPEQCILQMESIDWIYNVPQKKVEANYCIVQYST